MDVHVCLPPSPPYDATPGAELRFIAFGLNVMDLGGHWD
jgi:hypothetical protein